MEFGGIVVSDQEWTEYAGAVVTAGGCAIRVRFHGERQPTRIWSDGSGGLLCQKGGTGPIVPMYAYSAVSTDPNTEAVSESAVFLQRLTASGMPMPLVLQITNQIYARRPHDWPVPDALVNRILEKWQNREYT